MSIPLFTFKPISYTPITADHPWVMKVGRNEPEATSSYPTGHHKATRIDSQVMTDRNVPNRCCRKYSHIKSRITPEETSKYLERKKVRERQRIEDVVKRETEEMQECTLHPTRSFRRPY